MNSKKCPQCGLVNFAGAQQCKRCQLEFLPRPEGVPAATEQPAPSEPAAAQAHATVREPLPEYEPEATPIGGWLVVFAIYLGLLLVVSAFYISNAVKIFSSQEYQALTTPGSKFYVGIASPGMIFEFGWACAVALGSVVMLVRFFGKKYSLPRIAAVFFGLSIVAAFIDLLVGLNMHGQIKDKVAPFIGKEKAGELFPAYIYLLTIASIILSAMWLAYVKKSRRVESTFIY